MTELAFQQAPSAAAVDAASAENKLELSHVSVYQLCFDMLGQDVGSIVDALEFVKFESLLLDCLLQPNFNYFQVSELS